MEMGLLQINAISPHVSEGKTLFSDSGAEIDHASQFVAPLQIAQDIGNAEVHICSDTTNMGNVEEKWARRPNWVKHLEAYQKRTGATVPDVAKALKVSESTIYSLRTRVGANTSERVKVDSLRLKCGLFLNVQQAKCSTLSHAFHGFPSKSKKVCGKGLTGL